MKETRRKHSSSFKEKVATEALKEKKTLSELSKRFDMHPQTISKWKQEFLSRSSEIFSTKNKSIYIISLCRFYYQRKCGYTN